MGDATTGKQQMTHEEVTNRTIIAKPQAPVLHCNKVLYLETMRVHGYLNKNDILEE
ncbi:hypothetical protein [Phyllobacterium sp. SL163]|uniref:hypothetical protein n=1 Tax=unclassified Phyllobacterium TaxID=2638441 RepID=UPI001AD5E5A5|nr:hypothetical protein [Phyllobacterium sp.]